MVIRNSDKLHVFVCCLLLFVALVSVYDCYASWQTDSMVDPTVVRWSGPAIGQEMQTVESGLYQFEKNPAGRWLLASGGLTLFLWTKTIGTLIVVCLTLLMYKHRPNAAIATACGLAAFQGYLLIYLTLT